MLEFDKCLLLTEFESRTATYGARLFPIDLWPKPAISRENEDS